MRVILWKLSPIDTPDHYVRHAKSCPLRDSVFYAETPTDHSPSRLSPAKTHATPSYLFAAILQTFFATRRIHLRYTFGKGSFGRPSF